MTWKQVKEMFERNGVKDDDEISYIDTYPCDRGIERTQFERNERGEWKIW